MSLAVPSRSARTSSTLFAIVLLDLTGFGIVLPLLPTHGARFTTSEAAIGVLVAAYSLMQFLLAPWWGRVSDRRGRRPVLMAGLAASALSYLMFAWAGNYWMLLASRVVAGGIGATVNVSQAVLADVTAPEGRTRAMGLVGVAFGMGFILGPAIAALTARQGAVVPGYVAAGICLLSLLVAAVRLPETGQEPAGRKPGPVSWRTLALPFSAMFLTVVGFAAITVVFPLFTASALGFSRRATSMAFVLMGFTSALVQGWLLGRATPRLGERRILALGGALMGLGLAALPLSAAAWMGDGFRIPWLLAASALVAAGSGFAWPGAAGLVSRLTEGGDQGAALGMLHSVASLARVVGPVAAGIATDAAGAAAAFTACALVAGAGAAAAFVRQPR